MNYLAHLYLSGNNKEIMIGNFIADAIKGNNLDRFNQGIKKGIKMHRLIDSYTDHNKIVLNTNRIFNPAYGKYSGVVTDMVFDHFLAKNWHRYHNDNLSNYVNHINEVLLAYFPIMPYRIQLMMPFWIKHRWPEIYKTQSGLVRALKGMPKYTTLPNKSCLFVKIFQDSGDEIEKNFCSFFETVRQKFANYDN